MRQAFFFTIVIIACSASADEPDAKPRDVPLSSIVTTSPQKGMIQSRDVFSNRDHNSVVTNGFLDQILTATKSGASNVFLIDAKDRYEAVGTSARVILGAHAADKAVRANIPKPKHEGLWVVAYLGSGPSSPTWWTVEGVSIDANKIRLRYRKSPPAPATDDIHPYYYWIPLGSLDNGAYELELYDLEKNCVMLMRLVTIEKEQ
jgi:hypothetical protein